MTTETKIIIAGGRDFSNYELLKTTVLEIAEQFDNCTVVSGGAKGADALAIKFANEVCTNLYVFPAKWNTHGMSAGYVRNREMADFSDVLIAFWDGKSKGTGHMIQTMKSRNKPVFVYNY